jgi:hypothetical protein
VVSAKRAARESGHAIAALTVPNAHNTFTSS